MIEYLNYAGLSHFFDKLKVLFAKKTETIKTITRDGTTFTATRADGSTFTFNQQDSTYNAMIGASNTVPGQEGLVPAPAITNREGYLKGNATWENIQGIQNEDIEDSFLIEEKFDNSMPNCIKTFDAISYPLKSTSPLVFGITKDGYDLQALKQYIFDSYANEHTLSLPISFPICDMLEINIANKNLLKADQLRTVILNSVTSAAVSNANRSITLPNGKSNVREDENARAKLGERIFMAGARYLITLHVVSDTTKTMFSAVYRDGTVVSIQDCFNGEYAEYESNQNLAYIIMNNSATSHEMTFYPDDSSIVAIDGFIDDESLQAATEGLYFSDSSYYTINSNNTSKTILLNGFVVGGQLDLENKILYTDYDVIQSYNGQDVGDEWLDSNGLSSFEIASSPTMESTVIYYNPHPIYLLEQNIQLSSIDGKNLLWMKLKKGSDYINIYDYYSTNFSCPADWSFKYFLNDDVAASDDINSSRDLKKDFISEIEDTAASFPVPAVGEVMSVIMGKIIKFFGDTVSALNSKLNKSDVTTSLGTTTTGKALDATAGKTLNDKITTLNDSLNTTTGSITNGDLTVQYRKCAGIVTVYIANFSGVVPTATTEIGTVPSGYRPPAALRVGNYNGYAALGIERSGSVTIAPLGTHGGETSRLQMCLTYVSE